MIQNCKPSKMEDINLLPDLGPKAMRERLLGIGVLLMGKYFIIRITKIAIIHQQRNRFRAVFYLQE